jgi:endonuclease YncB( thermonuclease family)
VVVRSFLSFLFLVPCLAFTAPEYNWEEFEGCTLVSNAYRDGDSFHVQTAAGKEFICRLYFVDAPEDSRFPDRIAKQATYFGVPSERVQEVGDEAAEFTGKLLASKPFTVYTLWQRAGGASAELRFYVLVRVDGMWLSSLLVENCLARIYGKRIGLPDTMASRDYLAELSRLKEEALQARRGDWRGNTAARKGPMLVL